MLLFIFAPQSDAVLQMISNYSVAITVRVSCLNRIRATWHFVKLLRYTRWFACVLISKLVTILNVASGNKLNPKDCQYRQISFHYAQFLRRPK